jgi:hypothetical protein
MFPGAWKKLTFSRWLDSQSAPRPGEPDRRCDTIAELVDRKRKSPPLACVVELFTGPDADALDRCGEYLWRFRRELRHGPHGQDKYHFVAALIFLTGRCSEREVRVKLPGEAGVIHVLAPRVLELESEDAVAFLDAIAQNRLSVALLPWAPLMRNGQTAAFASRWLTLSAGLGVHQRRDAASVALTLSELTNSKDVWKPVLEAVTMNESSVFREVRDQGRLETRREVLVKLLRRQLRGDDLAAALTRVEQQSDLSVLARWFDQALELAPEQLLSELNK